MLDRDALLELFLKNQLTGAADRADFEKLARADDSFLEEIAARKAVRKMDEANRADALLADFEAHQKRKRRDDAAH